MTTITVSISESLKEFLDEQIGKEGLTSVDEYVAEILQAEQKRKAEERLEALLLEGLESDASEVTTREWAGIRAEVLENCRKQSHNRG